MVHKDPKESKGYRELRGNEDYLECKVPKDCKVRKDCRESQE